MSDDIHSASLLPQNGQERRIAMDLYESVKSLPIISPHGHVPVDWFAADYHFTNPTELFITPDHYITRLMHAHGIPLKDLGVGQAHFGRQEARHAFELLGSLWPAFAGTPMRWWFEDSLINVFGIHERFGPETAGKIYDQINDLLCQPEFSTKELAKKFNIELNTEIIILK